MYLFPSTTPTFRTTPITTPIISVLCRRGSLDLTECPSVKVPGTGQKELSKPNEKERKERSDPPRFPSYPRGGPRIVSCRSATPAR